MALNIENSSFRERVHDLELRLQKQSSLHEEKANYFNETIKAHEGKLEASISGEAAAKDQVSVLLADLKARETQIHKYDADLTVCRKRIVELESSLRAALAIQTDNANNNDAVRAELIEMKVSIELDRRIVYSPNRYSAQKWHAGESSLCAGRPACRCKATFREGTFHHSHTIAEIILVVLK